MASGIIERKLPGEAPKSRLPGGRSYRVRLEKREGLFRLRIMGGGYRSKGTAA